MGSGNIMVMLGGAGGAYQELFRHFDTYYSLLKKFLEKFKFIKGIDLDVEEVTDINNIYKTIVYTLRLVTIEYKRLSMLHGKNVKTLKPVARP